MTVWICRAYRGFEFFTWWCETCIAAKKAAGFDVEQKRIIEQACDRCSKR